MKTTRSSKEKRKLEPKTELHDLTDDVLANILLRVNFRKDVSRVCRKWYELDRAVTRELSVGGTRLVPPKQALAALSSRYFNLTKLNISHNMRPEREQVNDECLRCIPVGCVNLTDLTLVHCDYVTDVGIGSIGLCPTLIAVRLRLMRRVTGKGLLSLVTSCPSLRLLHIQSLNFVRDLEWLEFIGTHGQIESLAIRECRDIVESELYRLGRRGWRNLREFFFLFNRSTPPSNALHRGYAEDQLLRAWKFEDPEGTEYCPNLEMLSLWHCVSMPGTGLLWILSQCKALRRVEILHCDGVQDVEMRQFTKNNPQVSSIFWISDLNFNLTNQILVDIGENCRHLESLRISQTTPQLGPGFSESGMVALLEGCTRLKVLYLVGVPCFGERTMASVGHSTSLEDLQFVDCKDLNDEMLLLFGSNVTTLRLMNCPLLTDKSLNRYGSSHRVLAYLRVHDCPGITKEVALGATRRLEYYSLK